jgi:hypothetical protein
MDGAVGQSDLGAEGEVDGSEESGRGAGRGVFHATISSISDAFLFA